MPLARESHTDQDYFDQKEVTSYDQESVDSNPASSKAQGFSALHTDDELAQLLKRVDHDNEYVIDRVLKKSDFEETQLVYKCESNGSKTGPFIRKYLNVEAGVGSVYEKIFNLQHSGVSLAYLPTIYECYFLHNTLIVVMEYIQGETLQEVMYRCDPSVELAVEVFPKLCSAVRELHEKFNPPLIHRDLKPANIIMSFNRLTLIDFGIAREYRDGLDKDTVRFGTREYAPPEQFGYGQTDMRSDVYALGMLLYYCLTEETADALVRKNKFVNSLIPEELRCVIEKACAFDPQDRYASVSELEADFTQACHFLDRNHLAVPTGASAYVANKQFPPPSGNPIFAAGKSSADSASLDTIGHDAGYSTVNDSMRGTLSGASSNTGYGTSNGAARDTSRSVGRRGASGIKTSTIKASFKDALTKMQDVFASIPLWVGVIWNIFLVLLLALGIAGCISAMLDPAGSGLEAYPFWYRAYGCMGFVGISWMSITYVLVDKRLLFRKLPRAKRFSFMMRVLIFAIGIPCALMLVLVFLTLLIMPPVITWS